MKGCVSVCILVYVKTDQKKIWLEWWSSISLIPKWLKKSYIFIEYFFLEFQ